MDRELQRLEAVDRFKQLDPAIATDLNDIVNLAAQICNTPIAIITLLDKDTQWFKAATGTEITQTARETAFCNYTIEQDGVMVLPDLGTDDRYKDNPLVTGDMKARFYAGAPLTTKDGYSIGSLCVVDHQSRGLDDRQRNTLKVFAKQVINLMELNWSLKVLAQKNEEHKKDKKILEESEIKLNAVFNSTADLHVLVGKDLDILAFNQPAANYIYNIYKQRVAVGDRILSYVDQKVKKHFVKYFAIALKGKTIRHELLLRAGTEFECWREIKLVPIRNNEGGIIGVALNSVDITKRKQQEKQIIIQNEALTRIAIIQSHELRRPVASLLGLMHLMKLEEVDFGYFNIMEITVKELDEKIRIIVADSEKTINAPLSIVA
jgi:PAS domain S-box-containing protein